MEQPGRARSAHAPRVRGSAHFAVVGRQAAARARGGRRHPLARGRLHPVVLAVHERHRHLQLLRAHQRGNHARKGAVVQAHSGLHFGDPTLHVKQPVSSASAHLQQAAASCSKVSQRWLSGPAGSLPKARRALAPQAHTAETWRRQVTGCLRRRRPRARRRPGRRAAHRPSTRSSIQ